MAELDVRDVADNFQNSIIIDFDEKTIWIIKYGKIKVYPEKYFEKLIQQWHITEFGDDNNI